MVALAVVMIAGIVINFTPLHATLLNGADRNELPIIGALYEEIHDSHQEQGVYRGIISSIQNNKFVITQNDNDKDTDDGTSTIIVPAGFDTATFYIGERVYIAGKLVHGVVNAYGIQEFTANER